jgi:hypothetical protein
MILTDDKQGDSRMVTAFRHLLKPVPADGGPVVWFEGKRYAGFRDRSHAEFFIEQMGYHGAEITENYFP